MKRYFIISLLFLGSAVQIQGAQAAELSKSDVSNVDEIITGYETALNTAQEVASREINATPEHQQGPNFQKRIEAQIPEAGKTYLQEQVKSLSSDGDLVLKTLVERRKEFDFGSAESSQNLLMNVLLDNLPGSNTTQEGAALATILTGLQDDSEYQKEFGQEAVTRVFQNTIQVASMTKNFTAITDFAAELPDDMKYYLADTLGEQKVVKRGSSAMYDEEYNVQDVIYPGFSDLQTLQKDQKGLGAKDSQELVKQKKEARAKIIELAQKSGSVDLLVRAFNADSSDENRQAIMDAMINMAMAKETPQARVQALQEMQDAVSGGKLGGAEYNAFQRSFETVFVNQCQKALNNGDVDALKARLVFMTDQGKTRLMDGIIRGADTAISKVPDQVPLKEELFGIMFEAAFIKDGFGIDQKEFSTFADKMKMTGGQAEAAVNYMQQRMLEGQQALGLKTKDELTQKLKLLDAQIGEATKEPEPKGFWQKVVKGLGNFKEKVSRVLGLDPVSKFLKNPNNEKRDAFIEKYKDDPKMLAELVSRLNSANKISDAALLETKTLVAQTIAEQINQLQDQGKHQEAAQLRNNFLRSFDGEMQLRAEMLQGLKSALSKYIHKDVVGDKDALVTMENTAAEQDAGLESATLHRVNNSETKGNVVVTEDRTKISGQNTSDQSGTGSSSSEGHTSVDVDSSVDLQLKQQELKQRAEAADAPRNADSQPGENDSIGGDHGE